MYTGDRKGNTKGKIKFRITKEGLDKLKSKIKDNNKYKEINVNNIKDTNSNVNQEENENQEGIISNSQIKRNELSKLYTEIIGLKGLIKNFLYELDEKLNKNNSVGQKKELSKFTENNEEIKIYFEKLSKFIKNDKKIKFLMEIINNEVINILNAIKPQKNYDKDSLNKQLKKLKSYVNNLFKNLDNKEQLIKQRDILYGRYIYKDKYQSKLKSGENLDSLKDFMEEFSKELDNNKSSIKKLKLSIQNNNNKLPSLYIQEGNKDKKLSNVILPLIESRNKSY